MRLALLLPVLLTACSAQSATDSFSLAPDSVAAQSRSHAVEHSVTGSGLQQIAPGFEYSFSSSVHSDASGRVSGKVITHIIDLTAYGYPGQVEIEADATCLRVVGNTAYVNAIVTKSTDPIFAPAGSRSIFWVVDGGKDAPDVGHAGPGELFDPNNLICTSTPPLLPPDAVNHGNFVVR